MKKLIFFAALVLISILLLGQEQEQVPVQPQDQPQVQAAEPSPTPPQGKDLKKVRFPEAFIEAGKEYPAGDYWLILTTQDGPPRFTVHNAQKELLFEELAVVKGRSSGRTGPGFRVSKELMTDKEYFRVKVTTPGEWLMGYFLVKK
jgi:hypothetical protein